MDETRFFHSKSKSKLFNMLMDDAPVLIPFISFLNGVLLRDEPCYKFMLRYGFQNYFRQFTKTFSMKTFK